MECSGTQSPSSATWTKAPPDTEPRVPLLSDSFDPPGAAECGTSSAASPSVASSPWGMSLVVTLGSGISATAFGVHLVAYASPWLPSLDLSLLLRLDLGFLASASPSSSTPVAAASAAGLLGSSLAAADVLGGRLPLLFVLCIATAFVLLSFLASPAAGSSLLSLPIFAARALVRQAYFVLCRGFAKGASGPASPASAAATLLKVLSLLVKALRALLVPIFSSAVLPLLLLPKFASSSSQPKAHSGQGSDAAEPREGKADVARMDSHLGCSISSAGGSERALPKSRTGVTSAATVLESQQGIEEEVRDGEVGPGGVTEGDLEELVSRLELREVDEAEGPWEMIVDKASSSVDYCAWRRDPKSGGPTEYKSWTRFYGCTAKDLCAFYLDCDHQASYEAIIRSYENLGFIPGTGQETGRTVKKYPLCSPREYILGWRVWVATGHGPTATYYCVTKAVEHDGAPRTQALRRVDAYRCSWRVREVFVEGAGWSAEVDMYLQEDCGMARSMAKLAFRRSIWGYIQSTDMQLRLYFPTSSNRKPLPPSVEHAKLVPGWIQRKYLPETDVQGNELSVTVDEGFLFPPSKSVSGLVVSATGSMSQAVDVPLSSRHVRAVRRQPQPTGAWSTVKRRALPVLAAAAGIGTMTIARGPVGLAAKVLVACAVRVLAAEHNVAAKKQPLRLSRQRSRSKTGRQLTKISR